MGGGRSTSSNSSSSEEDGDAEWRAGIDSVTAAAATFIKQNSNVLPFASEGRSTREDEDEKHQPRNIKHYQIKAQKVLDSILEKTIEVVRDTAHTLEKHHAPIDTGVRLFKRAPVGIVFDHVDELHGPKKKPRIVPGEELDENSKKFRRQVKCAAIDGADIMAAAKVASAKSLTRLEAKEVAFKAAKKQEEERVAELKKIRGERWLPSVAKQMRVNTRCKR